MYWNNSSNDTSASGGADESSLTWSVTITLAVFMVVTIFGNLLVCVSFYRQSSLNKVCYIPVISLAIADLLCGAVAMPAYIAKKHVGDGAHEGLICDFFRFSYFFTEYASVMSLTTISIERFVAVRMPIRHKYWLTKRKMVLGLALSWLDALIVAVLPFFWTPDRHEPEPCRFDPTRAWSLMVILANVFLPFLIMLCCHAYTISYALRFTRRTLDDKRSAHSLKREKDITRTFALVVGIFIICWGPSSFYYFVRMVCPACYGSSFKDIKQIFNAVVKLLTFANSCLNPLIYCWLNPTLRRAFVATLIGKKAARKQRQEELTSFNKSFSPQSLNIEPKKPKNATPLLDQPDYSDPQ